MEMRQINLEVWDQAGQPSHYIRGLEDHVCDAIAVWPIELAMHVDIESERQALFRNRRPGDIAAKTSQLLAFIGPRRYSHMPRESGHFADLISERLVAGW